MSDFAQWGQLAQFPRRVGKTYTMCRAIEEANREGVSRFVLVTAQPRSDIDQRFKGLVPTVSLYDPQRYMGTGVAFLFDPDAVAHVIFSLVKERDQAREELRQLRIAKGL